MQHKSRTNRLDFLGSEECTKQEGRACPITASVDEVVSNIARVKEWMQSKPWYKLFATPPLVGHADTPKNAVLSRADFVGTNIFPFWNPAPIEKAWDSFEATLQSVKERAGNVPVWITETGWPSAGTNRSATLENMQKYWSTVGCALIGKYTTFWFELEKDTHDVGNLDWGLVDIKTQKPKIHDLSCPGMPGPPALPSVTGYRTSGTFTVSSTSAKSSTAITQSSQPSMTLGVLTKSAPSTISLSKVVLPSPTISSFRSLFQWPVPVPSPVVLDHNSAHAHKNGSTTHITLTSTITVQPSPDSTPASDIITITSTTIVEVTVYMLTTSPVPSAAAPASQPVVFVTEPTGCITISLDASGHQVTISNPPVGGKCPLPTYTPPPPPSKNATTHAQAPEPHPTGCVIVGTATDGNLTAIATEVPGMCYSFAGTAGASTNAIPTVYVTEATGCITVSKAADGVYVTVASNPPVSGSCSTPAYTRPPPSSSSGVPTATSLLPEGSGSGVPASTVVSPSSSSARTPTLISLVHSAVAASSSAPTAGQTTSAPRPRACKDKRRKEVLRRTHCENGPC